MPPPFIPGVELARLFYAEVVGPLLETECPGLAYSAALIGWGSEVLGFDSPRSTDHNWGPRLQVFLADDAVGTHTGRVAELLAGRLPAEFRGYPTVFATSGARAESAGHWVAVAGCAPGWLARSASIRSPGLASWTGCRCRRRCSQKSPAAQCSTTDWRLAPALGR